MGRGLRIIEVFRSVQGEGPRLGEEAVFLRLAYCNLYCRWCDTKYSWAFGGRARALGLKPLEDRSKWLSVGEVIKEVVRVGGGVRHLVITGGEPLLWLRELIELARWIKEMGWFIEVETNGTMDPGELVKFVDQFNVSPKLSNSGVPRQIRIREGVLRKFASMENTYFKFVIDKESDEEEVESLMKLLGIRGDRVYLMSQCTTREECLVKDEELTKPMARRLGVRFTPRLHIILGIP